MLNIVEKDFDSKAFDSKVYSVLKNIRWDFYLDIFFLNVPNWGIFKLYSKLFYF